jgi:SAM-dependent methyltransferase
MMHSPDTNLATESMEQKVEQFAGQVVADLAAAMAGVMTNLGHKLGLYRAMAESGPIHSDQLARRTETNERSVREWLNGQVAGGYVLFDAGTKRYLLPPEHAFVLANPDSPAFIPPAFDVAASLWHDEEQILAAFRSGKGMGWHEHNCRLFSGTEAFFRSGYRAHLTQSWIPSLGGVKEKLAGGGRVADVGCGHGASTILMAQEFPRSRFVGIDYHESSIAVARERADEAGVADQIRFEVATPQMLVASREKFDLICFMDSLHDMGNPLEAAWASRQAMASDGALMLVEPFASDRPEENVGPVARMYYSASAGLCTQNALSQGGHYSLGAQAGAAQLLAILNEAEFRSARVAMQTPFNLIIEARH